MLLEHLNFNSAKQKKDQVLVCISIEAAANYVVL